MFTLAVKSETYKICLFYIDLTFIVDLYYGLYCKTSADYKNEVGRRSGEGLEEIHSGAFTEYYPHHTWISCDYNRERN